MDERRSAEERLSTAIERREARCGVVGLGFIGSVMMDALTQAGFPTVGYDRSPRAVERFGEWMTQRHGNAGPRWVASDDPEGLRDAQVVMVAVRALPRPDGSIDVEPVESAASLARGDGREPRLVLLQSTVPCGTTRCFAARLQGGPGLFVAHAPERLSVGHDREVLRRTPHLTGGLDEASGRVASRLLAAICEQVKVVSSPEVSELSKLLENAFLTTGIALSNEVTRLAHAMGVSAEEVCAAAATKPFGYFPFFPGPGMGGHCLGNDLAILLSAEKRFDVKLPMMNAVAEASARGPETVLRRFENLVAERGGDLRKSRVLLVGVGFKPGTGDTTESPAREIARLLQERGAEVSYLDSLAPHFAVQDRPMERVGAECLAERDFDAAIVCAGDATAPLERLAGRIEVILDTRGRNSERRPAGVHAL